MTEYNIFCSMTLFQLTNLKNNYYVGTAEWIPKIEMIHKILNSKMNLKLSSENLIQKSIQPHDIKQSQEEIGVTLIM